MSHPRRLRIAFAADLVDGANGGARSAGRFVAALRERHEVTVLAAGAGGPGDLPAFTIPPFGRLMREMGFVFAWPRRETLERVIGQADVLHVQFPFWLGVRATAMALRLGTPVVAASHLQPENMFRNAFLGLRTPRLAEATWRLFLRTVYARADAVVCPSEFARGELVRRGLRVPAEVISNGIAPRFTPGDVERPAGPDGRFLLLAVGRLAREKRLELVIEGVRRSRHADRIQLVITGRGPQAARLRRLAAGLPLPARVAFVPDDELLRLLRSADLLVHASEYELEGMAVLEALGCGLPALVADAPGSAARHLALGAELRFADGDPGDLAGKLDALLGDPEARRRLRRRALAAAGHLSLASSVERLEALYLRVARPARERPAPGAAARASGSTASPAAR